MTRSCTAAAAPCPAPARRTPGLMLTSPPAAAGRAPRGRETAGSPGDDPRGRFPAAERLQGQRSARQSSGGGRSPSRPAAVSEVEESSAPTSSPRRPRPRLPLRPATPPSPSARPCGSCGPVGPVGAGGRKAGPAEGVTGELQPRRPPRLPGAPRRPMTRDHAGLQNKRRCWRVERNARPSRGPPAAPPRLAVAHGNPAGAPPSVVVP